MDFTLTALTDDPALAARCDAAGVDRIGIDIERLHKAARQTHLPGSRISSHTLEALPALASAVRQAALFARLNPMHEHTAQEVGQAIAHGARVLMLPYFKEAREAERFVRLIDGRAHPVLLLETAAALVRLHEVLAVDGIGELMIGLNDLHLSMGLASPFELMASDVLEDVSARVRARGWRFGLGGLGRPGSDQLPVPADLVIAQHARLGSNAAWLARSFFSGLAPDAPLATEVTQLRTQLADWASRPPTAWRAARDQLRHHLCALLR
jgi:hypothetical protein